MTACINLREQFGRQYRISFDPAYSARHVRKDKLDPWMMQIPCKRGMIYPFAGDRLAVEIDGRPITAKRLAEIPGVVLYQDGDHEKTFIFPVDVFDDVAEIVKPRRRRQVTEAQRERGRQLAATYFRKNPVPEHS